MRSSEVEKAMKLRLEVWVGIWNQDGFSIPVYTEYSASGLSPPLAVKHDINRIPVIFLIKPNEPTEHALWQTIVSKQIFM